MTVTEQWKPVVGYEGLYEVSDLGKIKSLYPGRYRHGKILIQQRNKDGYRSVCLSKNKKSNRRLVHHLVLEAFVGLRNVGTLTRHLNDLPYDNRLENLSWGTQKDNVNDKYANGGFVGKQGLERWNR